MRVCRRRNTTAESPRTAPEKTPGQTSAIIIDEAALRKEVSEPSQEELVVGRLLNVYEPILNEGLLREAELAYKRRVMVEALIKIQSNHLDFSPDLIIPYEYFLFDRLHQRALVYPETVYSFALTYTCPRGKENLKLALRGFRDAAGFLSSNGLAEVSGDSVRLFRGEARSDALAKMLELFPQTTSGAVEYVATGVASKIGLEVAKTEALSLGGGGKGLARSLLELERPKKLLRFSEGVIFDDATEMVEEVARTYGFGTRYTVERKSGSIVNASEELVISGRGKQAKFVLKHFPELKSIKWVLLNLWGAAAKKFNTSPIARLQRECTRES